MRQLMDLLRGYDTQIDGSVCQQYQHHWQQQQHQQQWQQPHWQQPSALQQQW